MNNRLPTDLSQESTHDITRRVISLTYEIRQKNKELTEDEAVNEAISTLKKEGLFPRNRPMRVAKASKAKREIPLVPESKPMADEDTEAIKTIEDKKIDISNIFEKK